MDQRRTRILGGRDVNVMRGLLGRCSQGDAPLDPTNVAATRDTTVNPMPGDRATNKLSTPVPNPMAIPPPEDPGTTPPILARRSTRQTVPRDHLKPTHKGKVYLIGAMWRAPRKERVPTTYEYPEKQRVSVRDLQESRRQFLVGEIPTLANTSNVSVYEILYEKYRKWLDGKRNERTG